MITIRKKIILIWLQQLSQLLIFQSIQKRRKENFHFFSNPINENTSIIEKS